MHFCHWRLPTRHCMMPSPHKCLVCPSYYVKHERFLSINIFDVLCVISRVCRCLPNRARFARSGTSNIYFYREQSTLCTIWNIKYLFLSIFLMFYACSHACKHVSVQLCTFCIVWLFLQVFYKGQVFTTCSVRTVISGPIL